MFKIALLHFKRDLNLKFQVRDLKTFLVIR